jgi:D-alanyl-D-alanine carboxypeptidase/D-alanyl-D-alanine-endopeptidase (penicillin-binding protein 4)
MHSFPDYRLSAPALTNAPVFFRSFLLLLGVVGVILTHPAHAQDSILRLITNGGYIIKDGSGRHQYRQNELFVPASTLKILTSLVALELLGPEYRFETHIFLDGKGNLYIKGYGDPLLTSEIVLEIGNRLSQMGIRQLQSICLDDSAFDLRGETASEESSTRSYDAPNGALAVNFNAVSLLVSKKGRISSSDSQTPLLPLMKEIGIGLPPGLHRLNINTLPSQPGKSSTLRYTGELFTAQLQQAGITIRKPWKIQVTANHLQPILIHRSSANLEEIIKDCLKYSNNFIANQLFLACGIHTSGLPATWEKSRQTFKKYAATPLGLAKDSLVMMEGAGLSRQNRISPAAFIQILKRFKPFAALLSPRDSIPLKSGTLTGVYCFAGYLPKGEILTPFAILLNQPENNRNLLLKELQLATLGPVP